MVDELEPFEGILILHEGGVQIQGVGLEHAYVCETRHHHLV